MLTVKAPGIHFTLPSDWVEVSLRQFLNLYAKQLLAEDGEITYQINDVLRCLASDVTQLEQLGDTEEAAIIGKMPFITKQPDFSQLEQVVELNGHTLPTDIGTCTLLQKWAIEQVMRELDDEKLPIDYISISVQVLSIYLYPILTGKPLIDSDHVSEVVAQIEALPVTTALPLSAFFLSRLSNLTPTGKTALNLTYPNQQPRRWPQRWFPNWKAMRSWVRFGGFRSGGASLTKQSSS